MPLADLAARFGTPLYAYSADMIAARYREVDQAFSGYPHTLHYALKANSTLAIARLVRRQTPQFAISGVVGVAFGAFVASRTGNAEDFFLPGILIHAGSATGPP